MHDNCIGAFNDAFAELKGSERMVRAEDLGAVYVYDSFSVELFKAEAGEIIGVELGKIPYVGVFVLFETVYVRLCQIILFRAEPDQLAFKAAGHPGRYYRHAGSSDLIRRFVFSAAA